MSEQAMPRFKPAISGNPQGRPKGIPDRRSQMRDLLEADAPALLEKARDLALAGDTTALRLCLERVVPALRPTSQPLTIEVGADGPSGRAEAVVCAVAAGEIAPDEAVALLRSLHLQAQLDEMRNLEERLRRLEGRML